MSVSAIMMSAGAAFAGSQAKDKGASIGSGLSTKLTTATNAVARHMADGAGKTIVTAGDDLKVEPLMLMDERVARLSYATDVVEALQRLFTAYYLLSVASDNQIGNVSIRQRLGKYNPDRSVLNAAVDLLSLESYQFGLPFYGEINGFDRYGTFSPESAHPHVEVSFEDNKEDKKSKSDIMKQATEISNLSVGQIVNVEICVDDKRTTIPVMIRPRVIGASPESLVSILGIGAQDNSSSTRWLRYKVGDLSLKDLITTQDMIDDYRKAMFSDKTGYFRKANAQAKKGLLSTMLNGQHHIGAISSMAIVSKQTAVELERKYLGSLDNYRQRSSIFEKSLLMLLMVVDDDSGTVTVYTRDYEEPAKYWLKDIQKSGKSSNDLSDLLKSFLTGTVPGRL